MFLVIRKPPFLSKEWENLPKKKTSAAFQFDLGPVNYYNFFYPGKYVARSITNSQFSPTSMVHSLSEYDVPPPARIQYSLPWKVATPQEALSLASFTEGRSVQILCSYLDLP